MGAQWYIHRVELHTIIRRECHALNQHGLGKKPRVNGMYRIDKQRGPTL